jgi:hypothetical protein
MWTTKVQRSALISKKKNKQKLKQENELLICSIAAEKDRHRLPAIIMPNKGCRSHFREK